MEEQPNKVGRPLKYDATKHPKRAYKFALLGCNDKQLADCLEITTSTFKVWKETYPEFSAQIRRGREDADANVAKSLYKRAKGFRFEEMTVESEIVHGLSPEGQAFQQERIVGRKIVKKTAPADVAAIKMWLVNRQGDKWSDKSEVKATNTNINVSVTPEEAAKIKEALEKGI